MKRRKQKKIQSLKSVSLKLLIPIGIAVAGLLAFLAIGLKENHRLAEEYIKDTAELYVGQINRDITQIKSELIYFLEHSRDIEQLPSELSPEDAKYYGLLRDIRQQNQILKVRYREVKYFYVYGQEADVLIMDSGTAFPESIKGALEEKLMQILKEQEPNSQTPVWQLLYTGEQHYLVSSYFRDGKCMGCVIDLDLVFQILQNGIRKYQAVPFMKDAKGEILLPGNIEEKYKKEILSEIDRAQVYSYLLGGVGEIHLYVVPNSGMLEQILNLQALFAALILVLLVLTVIFAFTYYEKIMTPMKHFVEALEETDEEQMLNEDGKNNILELEFASGRFRTLLRKIQSLKIAVYEKELEEQKAELEYVQEQVRPHFLLNCLSVIHGIADEKGEKDIVYITQTLSEYMRYVFRDSKNQRLIREELDHIAAYVEIQKLRYGEEAFSYEVILDGEVEDCLVPPLLLQTLVENSIVHVVSLDKKIDISLYITEEMYEDGACLYISISDTGSGFSEEMLDALENDRPIVYNGRKHVGLQNIRRRLELMYGERASISFSNMGDNYGAVVEVRMPLAKERKM